MFPLLSAGITGLAGLAGSYLSSETSAQNTQAQIGAQQMDLGETEAFNAEQAQANREFQANSVQNAQQWDAAMSNTAYQRASADMKAAGLNPAMMFSSGSAASSPSSPTASGSAASIGTPNVPMPQRTSPLGGLGEIASRAMTSAVQANEMDLVAKKTAEVDLINKDLQRRLDAGEPEQDVGHKAAITHKSEQDYRIDEPAAQKADIWGGYPDVLKKGGVWYDSGTDVVKRSLEMIPGVRGLLQSGGSSAASPGGKRLYIYPPDNPNSATATRRAMESAQKIEDEISGWKNGGPTYNPRGYPTSGGRTGIPWPGQGY